MWHHALFILVSFAAYAQHGDVRQMLDDMKGTWREVGASNQAGCITNVEYDHPTGRVWLAAAGGSIWAGDTSGTSWTCINSSAPAGEALLMKMFRLDNGRERLVVVLSRSSVLLYDVGMKTWTQASGIEEIGKTGSIDNAIVVNRAGRAEIIVLGSETDPGNRKLRGVLYRSLDSGLTFQRLRYIDDYKRIWTDGVQSVWVMHNYSLSRIELDGTLTKIGPDPLVDYTIRNGWRVEDPKIQHIVFAGVDPGSVMMAVTRFDTTQVYQTTDVGETWTLLISLPFALAGSFAFGQAYENGAFILGGDQPYRSEDEGNSWKVINRSEDYLVDPGTKLHGTITMVKSYPNDITFICTAGGAYLTRNGARSVRNITLRNLNAGQYYSTYTSRNRPEVIYAGAKAQGLQRSLIDSGGVRSFQQMVGGSYARLVSGDNGASLFCVSQDTVMYIPDAESSRWKPVRRGFRFSRTPSMPFPPLAVRSSRPATVYLGGGSNTERSQFIYTFTYDGEKLVADSLSTNVGSRITALHFARSNDQWGYALTYDGSLWVTNDGGETWQRNFGSGSLLPSYIMGHSLAVSNQNPNLFAFNDSRFGPGDEVVLYDGRVRKFVPEPQSCRIQALAFSGDDRYIAAATDVGALLYDIEKQTWTNVTQWGGPDQFYLNVEYVESRGSFRFSTLGRGIWDFTIDAMTNVQELTSELSAVSCTGRLVDGVSKVIITASYDEDVTIAWYDIVGRMYGAETMKIRQGTQTVSVPDDVRRQGARTCLITTSTGRVAGCVVP